jgi:hypothetical protein
VYYVRDAEPFQIFDRFRLLPRVQDTTVILYLMPDDPANFSKRPQVIFRASIDSLPSTPYVPSRLEPGGDASAYQNLIQTGSGASGSTGKTSPTGGAK